MAVSLQVSILHPLATLDWEECAPLPVRMHDAQCVILDNVIYVGGGDVKSGDEDQLFMSSVHPIKWSACSTPTSNYGLTTYHSQLVLVCGNETATGLTTNKLWTSDSGKDWKATLPAMPLQRFRPSAVNVGTPEYLVVAGTAGVTKFAWCDPAIVNVLTEHGWCAVESLPGRCNCMFSTVHHGTLYFMGGALQAGNVYYCDVKSLISRCQQSHVKEKSPFPLWSQIQALERYSSSASFGGSFVSVGGLTGFTPSPEIVALSLSEEWVSVGKLPVALSNPANAVLPTGDLVVIGGCMLDSIDKVFTATLSIDKVFKASLRVSPYDPDMVFSMSSLSRLEEGAGIKVVSSLAEIPTQLVSVAGIRLDERKKRPLTGAASPRPHVFPVEVEVEESALENIVRSWESGSSQHPPTWRSLLAILRELGLKEMSEAIEDLMLHSGPKPKSLMDQCSSVIMCALLPQRGLEPEQLHARLPEYVPPTLKRYLADKIKES